MTEKQVIEDSYLRFVNDDNSLYNLEVLSKDNADYELVEKSFMNTSSELQKYDPSGGFEVERICRVHQKLPELRENSTENVLVFHGTIRENVDGILSYGFRPSEGKFEIKL